jgi:hypothetical protein
MSTESPNKRRHVIPPAVQAQRMQRYAVYLMVMAFVLVGANYEALTLESVLWFAAGLTAGFSVLCAVAVVILHGLAWNFDRMRVELQGGRQARGVVLPGPTSPRQSWHGIEDANAEEPLQEAV